MRYLLRYHINKVSMQRMKSKILYILFLVMAATLTACQDNDSFTTSPNNLLTFSTEEVRMDTTFSTVPTATKTFWVYNRSGSGLTGINVRLKNGNQTGFRVNVDGIYLSKEQGFQVNDIEVRDKDSIRVFVELTPTMNGQDVPVKVEDEILFTLQSGVQQKMPLLGWSWDAELWRDVEINEDRTIASTKPIVIYGGMTVNEGATLTLGAGTTLYFHEDASLHVYGTLLSQGTAEKNVVLRGDRIDHMFDYLPYDLVPGQWMGVYFGEKSYHNELNYTDIHSTYDGVVCDSDNVEIPKLTIANSVIHNCQGYGLATYSSQVDITNTQITNTLYDCLFVAGGMVTLKYCTLAQFYPFDANRGAAIRFTNMLGGEKYPLTKLDVRNSIITGYVDDVLMRDSQEGVTENFLFDHCLIRTPKVEGDERMKDIIYEDVENREIGSEHNFKRIDIDSLRYDFRLAKESQAIHAGVPISGITTDRLGVVRPETPSLGAYEYVATKEEEEEKKTE